jgi:hypothetical protein
MPARDFPERFLVAFSLAGEQRSLVREIAKATEERLGLGTVFFDEWFEAFLAGSDADVKLQRIYADRCDLAVVCVSGQYGDKAWTQAEHEAIRARAMRARAAKGERERKGVMPIRVGDGEMEGILFNTIVPDVRQRSPEEAAELIVARLRLVVPVQVAAAPPLKLPPTPANPIHLPQVGPERMGLHQTLVKIFPRSKDIAACAAELGITDLPDSNDVDELWADCLRQLGNRPPDNRDIRGLLAAALQVEPANKFLLRMYR